MSAWAQATVNTDISATVVAPTPSVFALRPLTFVRTAQAHGHEDLGGAQSIPAIVVIRDTAQLQYQIETSASAIVVGGHRPCEWDFVTAASLSNLGNPVDIVELSGPLSAVDLDRSYMEPGFLPLILHYE